MFNVVLRMRIHNISLKAIKFAATFRDDMKLLNEAFMPIRHFTIVFEGIMFVNGR